MNFLKSLFDNPGKKIKTFAKIAFVIECIGAIITGIILFFVATFEYEDEILALVSLAVLFGGPCAAYMMTIFIYAFGELVDNTNSINDTLSNKNTGDKTPSNNTNSHSNDNKQGEGTTVSQKKSNPVNFTPTDTIDFQKTMPHFRYCYSCGRTFDLNIPICPTCKIATSVMENCPICNNAYDVNLFTMCPFCNDCNDC